MATHQKMLRLHITPLSIHSQGAPASSKHSSMERPRRVVMAFSLEIWWSVKQAPLEQGGQGHRETFSAFCFGHSATL